MIRAMALMLVISGSAFAQQSENPIKIREIVNNSARDIFGTNFLWRSEGKRIHFNLENRLDRKDVEMDSVFSAIYLSNDQCVVYTLVTDAAMTDPQIKNKTYGLVNMLMVNGELELELGSMYNNPHTVRVRCANLDMNSDVDELYRNLEASFQLE